MKPNEQVKKNGEKYITHCHSLTCNYLYVKSRRFVATSMPQKDIIVIHFLIYISKVMKYEFSLMS